MVADPTNILCIQVQHSKKRITKCKQLISLQFVNKQMNSENDEILDYKPKTDKHSRLVKVLYGLSFVFFAYWYVSDLIHWPYTGEALLLGLAILLAIILIKFVSKNRR